MIEDRLAATIHRALRDASGELGLSGEPPEVEITKPKQKGFGDFSTNVALVVAPRVGRPAREVAEAILPHLPADDLIERAEVAGPGFIIVTSPSTIPAASWM